MSLEFAGRHATGTAKASCCLKCAVVAAFSAARCAVQHESFSVEKYVWGPAQGNRKRDKGQLLVNTHFAPQGY